SLKGNAETAGIPVVVASTTDDSGKAFHLGVDDYLTKPIGREMFLSTIRRFVDARKPRVLIIDDAENDRYVLKHRLRGSQLEIAEATNGPDGIDMARG